MAKRRAKLSPGAGAAPRRPAGGVEIAGIRLDVDSVGERKNYNLQPGVTAYRLWPFSTIEWVADQSRYRARAIVQHTASRNLVAFNSWHQDFSDAERAIALLSNSLNGAGDRRVYNIFGEVIDVHTADIGGGPPVRVTEVQALIWSMRES